MTHNIIYRGEIHLNRMLADREYDVFGKYVSEVFKDNAKGLTGLPYIAYHKAHNLEWCTIKFHPFSGNLAGFYGKPAKMLNLLFKDVLNPIGIQVAASPTQYIVAREDDIIEVIRYDNDRQCFFNHSLIDVLTYHYVEATSN